MQADLHVLLFSYGIRHVFVPGVAHTLFYASNVESVGTICPFLIIVQFLAHDLH